jgi:transcriptional regulator with XRE-family HTH domain
MTGDMPTSVKHRKPVNRARACRAFGAAVRALRVKQGIPQEEYAYRCGVERAHMSMIETGRCNLSLETMMRLLPPLGASFAELAQAFEAFLVAPAIVRKHST